jgi:hypothetical protein
MNGWGNPMTKIYVQDWQPVQLDFVARGIPPDVHVLRIGVVVGTRPDNAILHRVVATSTPRERGYPDLILMKEQKAWGSLMHLLATVVN